MTFLEMKRIPLTQGRFAIIDDEDFERVSCRKWSYHHGGYAVGGRPQVRLHRFITNCPKGKEVDHVNRDKLDNRKSNLRICTRMQNSWNYTLPDTLKRGLPRGVYYRAVRDAYVVRIKVGGVRMFIGYFKNLEDATKAAKDAYLKYHGEFSIYAQTA